MAKELKVSAAGTMQGYSFKVWVSKNKDTLKVLLMGLSGAITNITLPAAMNPMLKWTITFAVPLVIKLAIDAIDFFTSDVAL